MVKRCNTVSVVPKQNSSLAWSEDRQLESKEVGLNSTPPLSFLLWSGFSIFCAGVSHEIYWVGAKDFRVLAEGFKIMGSVSVFICLMEMYRRQRKLENFQAGSGTSLPKIQRQRRMFWLVMVIFSVHPLPFLELEVKIPPLG
jgi:hypothetical protein